MCGLSRISLEMINFAEDFPFKRGEILVIVEKPEEQDVEGLEQGRPGWNDSRPLR